MSVWVCGLGAEPIPQLLVGVRAGLGAPSGRVVGAVMTG